MTQAMTTQGERILEVLVSGNLSVLTPGERVEYFERVCASLGLNPLTKPFEFITLNNKLTLYATKACTDQLRQNHGVSIVITDQKQVGDLYMVTVVATDKSGRQDSDMGVVATGQLKGENLANAMLKAITKAKRRATLSICGLGMLDETEIEDIPAASKRPPVEMPKAIEPPSKPPVNETTGEIVAAWTTGGLNKALREAALSMKDLGPILGEEPTQDNFADLIDGWLSENGGDLGDLIAAAIDHHTGQPTLV